MADFFAKGNKPINGYGGADHGIVELWKNANIGTAFAGQSIQISDFTTEYDAIIIVNEMLDNERGNAPWFEFDREQLNSSFSRYMRHFYLDAYNGKIQQFYRGVSFSLSGNTLSITFEDGKQDTLNSYGASATTTTNNGVAIPVRVLGLIHND